jgi:hypothetical protein
MPSIVSINISSVVAPTPPTLQMTGAIISQGATNLTSGATSLLTSASSLTPLTGFRQHLLGDDRGREPCGL